MTRSVADLIEARFGLPTDDGRSLPAEGALAALLERRVCRRFRPDPVPDEWLRVALAAALSAPSKSDLQQVAVIVVRDREVQAEIARGIPSMPWIATAPRLLVFCGDNRRARRIAALRDKPYPNDNLDQFMNAAVDCGLVLGAFLGAAQALGLGGCPISAVRNDCDGLARRLALPGGVFPVAGLALGYPADDARLSMRLPMSLTVHEDRYDDASLPGALDAYDARRAAREPVAPDQQRHVERFGRLERYGWSEDKARQYAVPERAEFGTFVRRQGFALT